MDVTHIPYYLQGSLHPHLSSELPLNLSNNFVLQSHRALSVKTNEPKLVRCLVDQSDEKLSYLTISNTKSTFQLQRFDLLQ